eukprot:TRINITY_DN3076_c0_g1_i1.p1 TRINITY_DN3076_c0_g1~~TRINITY_DN3076_c0_g1_i1.p1  ORF type:complete len:228 (-),score=38.40 TRINITY_DN3076_c0_g1_i1:80-763(-)
MKTFLVLILVVSSCLLGPFVNAQHNCQNYFCNSELRLANACVNCNGVDGWTNDAITWGNIIFRFISIYAALAPATYNVTIYPVGQSSPVMVQFDEQMLNNTQKTIALIGTENDPSYIVFEDTPWDTVLPDTKTNIRFINLSPDSDTLTLQIEGGQTIAHELPFGVASDYITLPPNTYTLEMLTNTSSVALTMPAYPFLGAHVFTVYAMGLLQGHETEVLQGVVAEDK